MAIRGRRTRRGRGRGRSDPPQPPQPCSSPPPPPPPPPSALLSPGVKDDENKWQKQGRVKGLDAFKHQQYLNMAIRGRGTRRGRGRGRSDPPQPSQLCTSPPPLPHTSLSPGVKDDKNKGKKQGRVKGLNAFKHQQKFIAVSSEENDESYDYEDEEMWLIGEKVNQRQLLRQQVADARRDRGRGRSDPSQPSQSLSSPPPPPPPPTLLSPGIGTIPGVSNDAKMSNATSDSDPHSNDPPANDPTSPPSSGGFHVETDRRKVIFVEAISNPRRFVPQTVTRDIISTVITRMPTPAEKWKNYSVNMKEELFKEFMGKYKFASDYDRNMARTVWERTCMDRYPDQLKNARKMALKQVNSTNLADTKGHGPKGMKTEVWDGLVDIWLTPKWRKRSDANRSNRAALSDSVLHTAGSISFGEHKRRMEGELKHPISFRDVYNHVHKKKDGEYVSQRSKSFIESYDTIMCEKYGEDSSMHPMVDSEVWTELSDPKKKRRVLGGRSLDIDTHGSMATSSSKVIGSSRTVAPTQEAIKEAVNIAMASFVQTQLVPMLEPILSMIGGSQVRNRMSQAPLQGGVVEEDHEDEDEDDDDDGVNLD